jgi:polar amino acid transport system substrate-binding protein
MRTFTVIASALGILILAPALFVTRAEDPKTLTVVADQWCPYNCVPNSATPGFGIEILKAVFEPKGIKVVYSNMPWTQALKETKEGKYAAAIGGTPKEFEGWVLPEEPTGTSRTTAFVKKGNPWRYSGTTSLAGKKVGVIEGYTYDSGGKLDTWIAQNPKSLVVASGEDALGILLKKLLTGDVDLILEDPLVFNLNIKDRGLAGRYEEAGIAHEVTILVGFSPARPESKRLAEIYTQEVRALRRNGKLAGILKKYGVTDWKKADKAG